MQHQVMKAITIKMALKVHLTSGGVMRLTRVASPQKMLAMAGELTGKIYKRGQYQQAYDDIELLLEADLEVKRGQVVV
jgi:hypothetical protein